MKKTALLIIIPILLLVSGIYTNMIKLPIRSDLNYSYVADFDDDKVLMGASHNVMVVKILDEKSEAGYSDMPSTLFSAQVISNIKGELEGEITLMQQAGYEHGILYVQENDELMKPGETYLVATRYNSERNFYTIKSHPNGKKLISKDKNLDEKELIILSEKSDRVLSLKKAYPNEILLDADIKSGNTLNSYKKN